MSVFYKYIVAIVLIFVNIQVFSQDRLGMPANKMMQKALLTAKAQKKNVVLLAITSNNQWSSFLEGFFKKDAVRAVMSKYFVVNYIRPKEPLKYRELENPGGKELFEKYFTDINSETFPTVFLIDKNGKKIDQFTGGFLYGDSSIALLLKTLNKKGTILPLDLTKLKELLTDEYVRIAKPSAQKIVEETLAEARKQNKKALIIFSASWCHWCHVLDTAMNEPSIKPFFDKNFVINHIIVLESYGASLNENRGGVELLKSLQGPDRNGIPFWFIMDSTGKVLADYNGYPDTKSEELYRKFEQLLIKITQATPQELNDIRRILTDLQNRFS